MNVGAMAMSACNRLVLLQSEGLCGMHTKLHIVAAQATIEITLQDNSIITCSHHIQYM